MCLAGLTFGIGLMDAGSPTPGTFLSSFGVCQFTNANSVTKLTIKANELQLACSDETHHTSAGPPSWSASRGWFVYVAKDMRVWAYNGDKDFWLLSAAPLESRSTPIDRLQEAPPGVVLKRLPKAVRSLLPRPQQKDLNKHGAAGELAAPVFADAKGGRFLSDELWDADSTLRSMVRY